MIETINGNILKTDCDIIIQQVNCLGVMGAGLAKQIDKMSKGIVKKQYRNFVINHKKRGLPKEALLGMVHYVAIPGDSIERNYLIANVFGQVDIRKSRFDDNIYTITESLLNR